VLLLELNVPGEHGAQSRSLVAEASVATYSPATQSLHGAQIPSFP
jgi:hypothetical protein